MSNPIWKGHISFGLVNIPIILYSSQETASQVKFHLIDKRNGARVKYQRINAENGKEVPWEEIGKGYEYEKDEVIPVEKGELEKVVGDNARSINIENFIDKKNINFLMIDQSYYLVPDKKGEKGYVLLRESLKQSNKIGIAKILISTKEHLAAVSVFENAIVVYTLKYADELRAAADFNIPTEGVSRYKISKKEIDIAKKLIASMETKWKFESYKDEFKKKVDEWLEKKINNIPIKAKRAKKSASSAEVLNLMDLLKKSIKNKKSVKNDARFRGKTRKSA